MGLIDPEPVTETPQSAPLPDDSWPSTCFILAVNRTAQSLVSPEQLSDRATAERNAEFYEEWEDDNDPLLVVREQIEESCQILARLISVFTGTHES